MTRRRCANFSLPRSPEEVPSLETLRRELTAQCNQEGHILSADQVVKQLIELHDLLCRADEAGLSREETIRLIRDRRITTSDDAGN